MKEPDVFFRKLRDIFDFSGLSRLAYYAGTKGRTFFLFEFTTYLECTMYMINIENKRLQSKDHLKANSDSYHRIKITSEPK
jgi:hypothetical protein